MLPFNIRFLVTAGVTGIYSWAVVFVIRLVTMTALPDWTLNMALLILVPGFIVAPVLGWRWISGKKYAPAGAPESG